MGWMLLTSECVRSLTFGWREISTIFGARMQIEQSRVGKVLSSCAIRPPIDGSFSIRYTCCPWSARSKAAVMPAIPPPMMRTFDIDVFSPVTVCEVRLDINGGRLFKRIKNRLCVCMCKRLLLLQVKTEIFFTFSSTVDWNSNFNRLMLK